VWSSGGRYDVQRKPGDTVQLKLRFPEALRGRLERAAKGHDQSLNSEIVARLYNSFKVEREMLDQVAETLVRSLDKDVLKRMTTMIREEETGIDAYEEWKDRKR
jgi:hypothetical protein